MVDEFTEEMHATLTVSKEVEERLDAGSFWQIVGFDASEEEIRKMCDNTIVTYEQAMKWKEYWQIEHEKSVQSMKARYGSSNVTYCD